MSIIDQLHVGPDHRSDSFKIQKKYLNCALAPVLAGAETFYFLFDFWKLFGSVLAHCDHSFGPSRPQESILDGLKDSCAQNESSGARVGPILDHFLAEVGPSLGPSPIHLVRLR